MSKGPGYKKTLRLFSLSCQNSNFNSNNNTYIIIITIIIIISSSSSID